MTLLSQTFQNREAWTRQITKIQKKLALVLERIEEAVLMESWEENTVFNEDDVKALCALDNQFTLILTSRETILSRRQYQHDVFTPILEKLRKQRRYYRKLNTNVDPSTLNTFRTFGKGLMQNTFD